MSTGLADLRFRAVQAQVEHDRCLENYARSKTALDAAHVNTMRARADYEDGIDQDLKRQVAKERAA